MRTQSLCKFVVPLQNCSRKNVLFNFIDQQQLPYQLACPVSSASACLDAVTLIAETRTSWMSTRKKTRITDPACTGFRSSPPCSPSLPTGAVYPPRKRILSTTQPATFLSVLRLSYVTIATKTISTDLPYLCDKLRTQFLFCQS